jgi:hypothetical protein
MPQLIKPTTIARKHIIAAIEAAPCDLEFKKYYLHTDLYRKNKSGGYAGIRISWTIK